MKQQAINVPEPKVDSRSLHQIRVDIIREFWPGKLEALARQLGASKGHLSEVMGGESGKHWPDDWTDYIEEHLDHRDEIAKYHARKRGLEVRPPRVMSPAEWKRRVSYKLSQLNGMGKALLEEALSLPDDVFADEEEA